MRRMYSKKQLEELISNMSGDILEVKNIKQLNDEQCNGLKVGDIVAKKTGKQYHCYIVTYKQDKHGLCLSYFDASVVETQSYDYTAGHWVYNSEDKTELGGSGLPEVSGADNGKVLEVIAGAWAKGGKKVNVIGVFNPLSLTDDEISAMNEGCFVNGQVTISGYGLKNPIIGPNYTGYGYILSKEGGYDSLFIPYYLNATAKTIEIDNSKRLNFYGVKKINEKEIPEYPANTGSFTLKCVDGVLTWVQDV